MEKQTPASSSEQFLCIEVTNTLQVMLPTSQLSEIITLEPTKILQIPDMPGAVAGIFNWQGEILWLIDMAYMMGFEPILYLRFDEQQKCRVVLVKSRENNLGLLIKKVGKLTNCEPENLSFVAPKNIHSSLEKCTKGSWKNPAGETLMILDIEAIIKHIKPG